MLKMEDAAVEQCSELVVSIKKGQFFDIGSEVNSVDAISYRTVIAVCIPC